MQIVALRESLYFQNGHRTYTILNVVESALIAMDSALEWNGRQRSRIGSRDNRRMNNLLRNCLRFQLCSPECESIYLLHPGPRQVVLSIPVSVARTSIKNLTLTRMQDYYLYSRIKLPTTSLFIFEVLINAEALFFQLVNSVRNITKLAKFRRREYE